MKTKIPFPILILFTLAGFAFGESVSFNDGWRFSRGEFSAAVSLPDFDAADWKEVTVPHDWAISGPFDPDKNGYAGKLPWEGEGWYRKTFHLDEDLAGRNIYLDFDGVMAFPQVYVNGHLVGEWDYGYNSFRVDATRAVRFGEDNVIAVRATTRNWGTRWYPGAGIYRKVTLVMAQPIHIEHWGIFVTTPDADDNGVPDTVDIRTRVRNTLQTGKDVIIEASIVDPSGWTISKLETAGPAGAGEVTEFRQSVRVEDPALWDVRHPNLYGLRVEIRSEDQLLDSRTLRFGFRSFEFTADDGFHLNGRRVQLYGVNLHHDLGPLGAAFNRRAAQRQLQIMKEMGINAIRTSHNPPAPEVLDLCDEMGLVVWDEVFDKWDKTAGRVGDSPPLPEFSKRQIRATVLRDRNHPSVVIWSIGNEIPPGELGMSPERAAYMTAYLKELDTTRPVGMGCHIPSMVADGHFEALDLTGWNYARRYADYREKYPDRPIVYSESASTLSTRGFYELPLPQRKTDYSETHQVDSYDLNAAPWSDIPDVEFALMEKDDFVAGEFVWTGFDYIGEPTPFDEAARSSYFGIVDLCGIPKDRFYLYRSHWRPETPTVHILPHWNWPERVGQVVPVFVYTNGDSAELFLNGQSLGLRRKGEVPERPADLALGATASASSSAADHGAGLALDGSRETAWRAAASGPDQWWQLDFGQPTPVGCLALVMEEPEKMYAYRIEASNDGEAWEPIASKPVFERPQWGGSREFFHEVAAQARFLRVVFTGFREEGVIPAISGFSAYPEPVDSEYYDVTYRYRLRWNDVVYQPGELRAVAYKDGEVIGEEVMRTVSSPSFLRLSPDRDRLSASGEDLSFVLVEAFDRNGVPCPLADQMVHFQVDGPGTIAAVGNGNPLSLEPFQADHRKLFNGKALLIVRGDKNASGEITINATADGMEPARIKVQVSNGVGPPEGVD